ncbi:hypothetical protein Q31a_57500 [Aureliella helgolandensis]|uniref:Uncharacterized protein n=1 Tax=Aureliella helgolandensis TaxID=2527968 RepID=A0A518GFI8_9BACT|nr:hypothetical protein Q31a_57500 [Aureliella helgolandensis]
MGLIDNLLRKASCAFNEKSQVKHGASGLIRFVTCRITALLISLPSEHLTLKPPPNALRNRYHPCLAYAAGCDLHESHSFEQGVVPKSNEVS